MVDAGVGDQPDADVALGGDGRELGHPVVVGPEAGEAERRIAAGLDAGPDVRAGVQDLGVDVVLVLLVQAGDGVEGAGKDVVVADAALHAVTVFEELLLVGGAVEALLGAEVDRRQPERHRIIDVLEDPRLPPVGHVNAAGPARAARPAAA